MKKTLILTTALCAFASAANAAKPFDGWSVGIHGGWNQDRVKSDFARDVFDKNNLTFNSGVVGVHFDWTTSKANAFLFGLGFNLGYNFGTPSETLFERTAAVGADTFIGKLSMEVKRKLLGEINARLGWNYNNKWALYGILAARAQSVKTTLKLTGNGGTIGGRPVPNGQGSESDVIYGFAPGLGFDVRLDESWSIGAQYKYFFESSAKTKLINSDDQKKSKFRAHNALVRVSYHF